MNDYLKELFIDEVKNLGKGGSGGVSSWNDLTDKPFYVESEYKDVIPKFTPSTIGAVRNGVYRGRELWAISFEDNTVYDVYVSNTKYTVTSATMSNGNVYVGNEDTTFATGDLPFHIDISPSPSGGSNGINIYWVEALGKNITLEVIKPEIVKTLDEKFLPDTVATKAYVEELIGGIENGTY